MAFGCYTDQKADVVRGEFGECKVVPTKALVNKFVK